MCYFRSVMLFRPIASVDALCSSAVVAGGRIPAALYGVLDKIEANLG